MPVAAVLALGAFLYHELRETPAVQAAQLLRKAAAAEDARPRAARRIQIRTRQHKLTRVVGGDGGGGRHGIARTALPRGELQLGRPAQRFGL